jgi:transposase
MALGRQGERQSDLLVTWREMPRSPGHVFCDRLQQVLIETGFDAFAEATCKPYYASKMGAPSIPPGRYFRMHMVGYFKGIDSERGIEWRCADSLSLREFLRLETTARVPDHSWLSKTRSRLPAEVHEHLFAWVLKLIAARGLVKGERIGVDASTMEANAALRTIVRRETGETCREMLQRMAKESGIETPSADDLIRLDRARKGKKLSNEDWVSATDAEAKIAKMKDGTTHLAYKPASAVDLDTGVVGDRRARVARRRKIEVAVERQIAVVIGEEELPPVLAGHPPAGGERRHLTGEMRGKGGRDGFHGMILPPCVGDV